MKRSLYYRRSAGGMISRIFGKIYREEVKREEKEGKFTKRKKQYRFGLAKKISLKYFEKLFNWVLEGQVFQFSFTYVYIFKGLNTDSGCTCS